MQFRPSFYFQVLTFASPAGLPSQSPSDLMLLFASSSYGLSSSLVLFIVVRHFPDLASCDDVIVAFR